MDDPHPPLPPPRPPVEVAGAARDTELSLSAALSREEVLCRRRRRLVQLCSLYRAQYWVLADELPARHGEYWWEHGASPALDDEPPHALPPPLLLPKENGVSAGPPENGVVVDPLENCAVAPPVSAAGGRAGCAASNCEAKAMPLSLYCFNHILLDPKQQLYQPCAFPTKKRLPWDKASSCAFHVYLLCLDSAVTHPSQRRFHHILCSLDFLQLFFVVSHSSGSITPLTLQVVCQMGKQLVENLF
ncbi:uncharacterized protein [Miscanthus floridulus]|uniref:uncharacterized protein isoform X2 n=1 Tax=Miscanthus floridulus TaxID=154761 RepID=UPI003457A1D9